MASAAELCQRSSTFNSLAKSRDKQNYDYLLFIESLHFFYLF